MNWKIPLFKIYWDERDVAKITEVIKSGMNWATGPDVQEFEARIARYIGTEYAVAFSSGTSALHAILAAYNIGKGDEVIVPSFTFIATANSPLFVGATPVFADIEEKTYGLDPEDVERKITPRTKAILPVHYAGCPCLIRELKKIAEEHKLIMIEDAAEAIGAAINGKKVGSFGDAAILSFCQNKVITTGEGGAVVTNSREIYQSLKLLRSHGRAETSDYFATSETQDYVTLGYNFRMGNILAALGIGQLEKIDKIISKRRKNAETMSAALAGIPEIELPSSPEGFFHVYQIYTIRIKAGRKQRDALSEYLTKKGIMTKVYFSPVHLTHFYKKKLGYSVKLPVTEKLSGQVLTLPMYPTLTEEEIDYIAGEVRAFFKGVQRRGNR